MCCRDRFVVRCCKVVASELCIREMKMNRRNLLGGLATLTTGAALGGLVHADEPKRPQAADQASDHQEACAKACSACANTCAACSAHCAELLADGKPEHAVSMKLCNDCETVCRAAAELCSRKSQFSDEFCKLCEEICNACADRCEQFSNDDHMKKCAAACRDCAAACQQMAAAAAR